VDKADPGQKLADGLWCLLCNDPGGYRLELAGPDRPDLILADTTCQSSVESTSI
jgi:hypothetical protein